MMPFVEEARARDACRKNIRMFLDRQIGRWTGLKAGCAENDITASFHFNEGAGAARYGTCDVEYSFRVLSCEGFQEGIEFHFADHELRFIATDYWTFGPQECDDILRALGEPPHRLPLYWRDEVIEDGEWVYPGRGIALGVIQATMLIARVVVYPPCPLNVYQGRYYNTRTSRELRA
jgi:hypothetical protein